MHDATVQNAVDGFFVKSALKMITLKTREKAVDGIGSELCPIGSFILVLLNPQVSLSRYQLHFVKVSLRVSFSKLDMLKVKNLKLLIFP
jgi:hypothetical protein